MARVLLLVAWCAVAVSAIGVDVTTEYGRIRGKDEHDPAVTAFYGIPFASPPLKNLRLKSPLPPTSWSNTRDCTRDEYFHICPQFHITKKILFGSEDCLYVNVYVPRTTPPAGGFPVMFWIYGGGYTVGDDYEFGFYRGKNLAAKRDVIVVEANYRLGSLGFLALPQLQAEDIYNSTGNYALQDQQAALAFTFRNIAQFSGNPNQITIFGESAGAFSVCWHLASPLSAPFYVAAIMESGSCGSPDFFISQQRGFLFGMEFAAGLGCNDSATVTSCLRGKSTLDMLNNSDWPDAGSHVVPPLAPAMPFGPVIDGSPHGLIGRPLDLIREGRWAKKPLIIGTNLNEGTIFIPVVAFVVKGVKIPLSDQDFNKTIRHFFNESLSDEVWTFYPKQAYKNNDQRAAFLLRDLFFTCQARSIARATSDQGIPTFLYQFVQKLDNWVDYDAFGDYHTIELPFVFDHQWPPLVHTFGPNEHALSNTITLYWSNHAKYLSPNGQLDGEVLWPPYNRTLDLNIFLEHPARVGAHLNADACDFWDTRYEKYYFD